MSNNFKTIEVFEGPRYETNAQSNVVKSPIVNIKGFNKNNKEINIALNEDLLSKHVLIIGGIGMGKTNTFKSIVQQTSDSLKRNDVMLIFDTKGDFYNEFGNEDDILISNTPIKASNGTYAEPRFSDTWNIFAELNDAKLTETSNEIASMMFNSHVKNSSQSFFPLAAKSIFAAVLRAIYRVHTGKAGLMKLKTEPSNKLLKDFFNGENIFAGVDESARKSDTLKNIVGLLNLVKEERGALGYISTANKEGAVDGQTLGVLAELRLVIDELFVGNFAKEGSFSITNAVRTRGAKRIFIEYDITEGEVLSPIYSLLVDLAIKESLDSRSTQKGSNAYFIIDEFKLLPHLKHMDDAVNFGRSLGVKFVIGVQNVSQIIENYGRNGAMNILSGFLTTFAFKVSDYETRNYLINLFGTNRKKTAYLSSITTRGVSESLGFGRVVEDWDIAALDIGECIVHLAKNDSDPYNSPFFLHTTLFNE